MYCKPGPSAHEPFVTGGWTEEKTVFEELAVRFGTKPIKVPYGIDEETTFFVEFRGCLFDDALGKFRSKFKDILYVRPAVYTREHKSLTKHRKVPKGEEPKEKVRKEKRGGVAGTSVEEW